MGAALALGTLGPQVALAAGGWEPKSAGRLASSSGMAMGIGYGASSIPWVAANPVALWGVVLLLAMLVFGASHRLVREGKLWWGLSVLFAVGVGTLSGESGGAGFLRHFLASAMGLDGSSLDLAVVAVRKTIHVCAYAGLGWSAGRLVLEGGRGRALPAVAWVAALAGFDELRQAVTPGRTGLASDVLIDLVGAAVAIGVLQAMARRASFTRRGR